MEIKLGKYKHFKGFEVTVIGVAKNSENYEEEFVVYKHLYEGHDQIWIRPVAMFLENVERDGYSGPRFEYLGE
jgi:hypothetical protein